MLPSGMHTKKLERYREGVFSSSQLCYCIIMTCFVLDDIFLLCLCPKYEQRHITRHASRATPNTHTAPCPHIALVVPLYKMGRLLAMTNQAHACARLGALAGATWSYAWLRPCVGLAPQPSSFSPHLEPRQQTQQSWKNLVCH